MEKWKLGVIVAMIVVLGGYGIYQTNAPQVQPPSGPKGPVEYNKKMATLAGKVLPAWNIPAKYWFNTPAPITLAQTKGKVTALEFFSTGCPHCHDAVPFLNSLYAKYKPKGVQLVSFQLPDDPRTGAFPDKNWADAKKIMQGKDWDIKYPVAYDQDQKLFQSYGGDTFPVMLILDKQGKVALVLSGYDRDKAKAAVKEKKITDVLDTLLKMSG